MHTELDEPVSQRFEIIKAHLGLKNDGEVIRLLIMDYYHEKLEAKRVRARREVEEDAPLFEKLLELYGDQFRRLGEE